MDKKINVSTKKNQSRGFDSTLLDSLPGLLSRTSCHTKECNVFLSKIVNDRFPFLISYVLLLWSVSLFPQNSLKITKPPTASLSLCLPHSSWTEGKRILHFNVNSSNFRKVEIFFNFFFQEGKKDNALKNWSPSFIKSSKIDPKAWGKYYKPLCKRQLPIVKSDSSTWQQ